MLDVIEGCFLVKLTYLEDRQVHLREQRPQSRQLRSGRV